MHAWLHWLLTVEEWTVNISLTKPIWKLSNDKSVRLRYFVKRNSMLLLNCCDHHYDTAAQTRQHKNSFCIFTFLYFLIFDFLIFVFFDFCIFWFLYFLIFVFFDFLIFWFFDVLIFRFFDFLIFWFFDFCIFWFFDFGIFWILDFLIFYRFIDFFPSIDIHTVALKWADKVTDNGYI
jgi:hypothetical protein